MRLGALVIAALAGASMAVQGTLNAVLGRKVGPFEASFIVHAVGAVLLGFALWAGVGEGSLGKVVDAPWYAFLGGPLSILIIWGVLTSVGRAGVSNANTAIVATQIVTALVLDGLGVGGQEFHMDWAKAVGAALLIAGAYLLLKGHGGG